MNDDRLKMLSHIPPRSDFSLETAAAHFHGIRCGEVVVQAELATSVADCSPTGFRVWFGTWSVVSWLEEGEEVLADSAELAVVEGLPVPREELAGCSRGLSVWSDPGINLGRKSQFEWFAGQLRERFAALHYDHFAGRWLASF